MSRSSTKTDLSAAQLAARRANARLSTGPRTPEGKAIAAMNSVQHGLCSNAAVLPGESVEEFQATLDGWVHELKPVDSYERELVYNMVCASIAIQRVRKADNAAVSARVRAAGDRWDDARAAGLTELVESLRANRLEVHAALLRRGDGCRWLIARWRELDAALAAGLHWAAPQRALALRLFGLDPNAAGDPTVRLVHGLGIDLEAATGAPTAEHAAIRGYYGLAAEPDPDPRAALRQLVGDELEALESLLPALEAADAAERESTINTSYIDTTDDGMRRHRYLQDHLRTLRQLSASLLASKKARHAPRKVGVEVHAPVGRPTSAPARNEPKDDVTHGDIRIFDEEPAPPLSRPASAIVIGVTPTPAPAPPDRS
jgi:hypothetical protein